ncbi:hypothetical protein GCM10020358_69110 [Amorphoplanes nipponensis]|uniref:Uncharacterized protein n=1 Tax=Actinoplanes nipponensis TaxID=135950 RepID=A0A919JP48_9ACTN|nr:ArsR family transcriptional regulator [Actinoplanes nipponensis]GIE53198.1 hypothetical protein Ani05nite_67320 [Actinoplanes nipponensis]
MAADLTRHVSSAVFGNKHRLELLLALFAAGEGGICVKDVADSCGAPTSVFRPPLMALVDAGLVRRLPAFGHNRRVLYAFTDVRAWTGLEWLVHDLGSRKSARGAGGGTES